QLLELLERLGRDLLVPLHGGHLIEVGPRQPVLAQVRDRIARVERDERLELGDGLLEVLAPEVGLPDEEAADGGEVRLRMPLDEPLKLLAGGRVLLLEKEALAILVELRGGRHRVRTAAEEAAAGEQNDGDSGSECSLPQQS